MAKRTYKSTRKGSKRTRKTSRGKRTRKTSRGKRTRKVSKRSRRCPKGKVLSRKVLKNGKLSKVGKCIDKVAPYKPSAEALKESGEDLYEFNLPALGFRIKKSRKGSRKSHRKGSRKHSRKGSKRHSKRKVSKRKASKRKSSRKGSKRRHSKRH